MRVSLRMCVWFLFLCFVPPATAVQANKLSSVAGKPQIFSLQEVVKLVKGRPYQFESIKSLVRDSQLGFGINEQDSEGKTFLHHAAQHGRKEVVELLLAMGADPTLRDNDNLIAFTYAQNLYKEELKKLQRALPYLHLHLSLEENPQYESSHILYEATYKEFSSLWKTDRDSSDAVDELWEDIQEWFTFFVEQRGVVSMRAAGERARARAEERKG